MTSDRRDRSNPAVVGFHQNTGSLLQDSAGLLTINGFALPAKLAEKRKLIEEFAHNDVKKVSMIYFTISFFSYVCSFLIRSSSFLCASLYMGCSSPKLSPCNIFDSITKLERHFPLHYFQASLKLHFLGGRFVGACQYAKSSPSGANWGVRTEGGGGGLSGFASICGGCTSNSEAHKLEQSAEII